MRRFIILLIAVIACGGAPSASESPSIDIGEYFVTPDSSRWAAGATKINVINQGEFPHTLVVSNSAGKVVYASPVLEGGESLDLRLVLDPDDYYLTCRIVVQWEGQIYDHFELGMLYEVEVAA